MADQSAHLGVDDVIITDELDRRSSRAPDYEIENRILTGLAETLASDPENLLQNLTDQLVAIGVGESAGISLDEGNGDDHVCRWVAVSGEWLPFRGGTVPFAASPCGTVIARDDVLLFRSPERTFSAANVEPLIGEILLAPFHLDGRPAGTVWAIKHDPGARFEREDARILKALSRFAAAARQALSAASALRDSEARSVAGALDLRDSEERVGVAASMAEQSEERYRTLFKAIDSGFCVVEVDLCAADGRADYRVIEANPAFYQQTGFPEEVFGQWLRQTVPDLEEHWYEAYGRVARTGASERFEEKSIALGRWFDVYASRVGEPEEGRVAILFTDITERKRAETALRESERHSQLLLAELQHRVRNILTMVRSVARRTAENCEDIDDYVRHLDGRLSSLSRVQTILTRRAGQGANLHDLVLDELEMQTASPAQYRIEGPEVELLPKAAEVLSLAVHELATNSIKYGVLSESSGTIRIGWSVDDRDGQAWLRFTWDEPVGPQPDRPSRTGFGSDLIKNRVPYELRGTGDIRIGGDKVEARIDFPLASQESKRESTAAKRDTGQ